MVNVGIVVTLGLNAVSAILILALAALGLAIIFGFMEVINLAHGAFLMLGAYVAWITTTALGIGFWPGLLLAPLVVGAVGFLCEVLVVRHLYHRLMDTILATWGISLALGEAVKLLFGATSKSVASPLPGSVDLGVTTYPLYRFFLMGLGIAVLVFVFALFNRTDFGVRLRAVIQDAEAATLMGLDEERMYQFAFAFGAGLAGLAGAAIAPITAVEPAMGVTYLVQSFFAVILGGAGTLLGVVPGAVIVAGLANTLTFYLSPVVAQTFVFVLGIIVVVVRPSGIMGEQ